MGTRRCGSRSPRIQSTLTGPPYDTLNFACSLVSGEFRLTRCCSSLNSVYFLGFISSNIGSHSIQKTVCAAQRQGKKKKGDENDDVFESGVDQSRVSIDSGHNLHVRLIADCTRGKTAWHKWVEDRGPTRPST